MVTQMATYRNNLPQAGKTLMLTDSGLETTLIFHDGLDLPAFAAYPLMETPEGRDTLMRYYRRHISIAADHGTGFVLEAPTWRASRDWGARLGHSPEDLARINRAAIGFLSDLRGASGSVRPMVISGNIGPRGDGYRPDTAMTAAEAERYHGEQIGWFAQTLVAVPPPHPRFFDYPTCATLVAEFDIDRWEEVGTGTGKAVDFVIPRELPG